MKKNTCWIIILLITGCFFGNLRASSTGKNYLLPAKDSVTIDTRLKALTIKESDLKSKIEAEDKKRNASYNDVSPETTENLRDQQDSICLDLRSQLISVRIELNELKKANALKTLRQHQIKKDK